MFVRSGERLQSLGLSTFPWAAKVVSIRCSVVSLGGGRFSDPMAGGGLERVWRDLPASNGLRPM